MDAGWGNSPSSNHDKAEGSPSCTAARTAASTRSSAVWTPPYKQLLSWSTNKGWRHTQKTGPKGQVTQGGRTSLSHCIGPRKGALLGCLHQGGLGSKPLCCLVSRLRATYMPASYGRNEYARRPVLTMLNSVRALHCASRRPVN